MAWPERHRRSPLIFRILQGFPGWAGGSPAQDRFTDHSSRENLTSPDRLQDPPKGVCFPSKMAFGLFEWRRGWDSNPRYACAYAGFRDRSVQPLWHLSRGRNSTTARDPRAWNGAPRIHFSWPVATDPYHPCTAEVPQERRRCHRPPDNFQGLPQGSCQRQVRNHSTSAAIPASPWGF